MSDSGDATDHETATVTHARECKRLCEVKIASNVRLPRFRLGFKRGGRRRNETLRIEEAEKKRRGPNNASRIPPNKL